MRTTTTIVTLLEQGARQVELLGSTREVRRSLNTAAPDTVICGERPDAELLPGCAFPPSPALIRQMHLAGKTVALKTANGTSAAFQLKRLGVKSVYIGCLNQCMNTARRALAMAEETGETIQLVCAARERGKTIALDDA
jgi:2-phosphosulfolactate phosphatase